MALLATLHDHQRAAERQALEAGTTVRMDGNPYDAIIANISASGCLFVCEQTLQIGDTITIGIAGLGRRKARIVRTLETRFGAEFLTPLVPSEIETAGAVSDESVVSLFPWPVVDCSRDDNQSFAISAVARQTRLMILAGLVASSWVIILAAIHIAK